MTVDHATQSQLADYLILITAAVAVSTLFRRLRIPPLLAYLTVGLLTGPTALGFVDLTGTLQIMAEFGVVFLLFSLGLEFSLARMIALRRLVFGLGGLQVSIACAVLYAVAILFGASQPEAVIIAGALALSSTAVVSKELVARNELGRPHGEQCMAILLFQDLAAVVFLILLPFLAGDSENSLGLALGLTLVKGVLLFVLMLGIGKYLLPPLFAEIAKARSDELFVLTVLMVSLLAAALTHSFGLSMALGAFIAGMMLSETHFKHQIEADIRPFRDLLLGLFFISVGLLVDFSEVLANWYWILLVMVCLVLGKALLISVLAYRFNPNPGAAVRTGLYLCQGGEFGFALFALGQRYDLVSPQAAAIVITAVILSITVTPALMASCKRLDTWFERRRRSQEETPVPQSVDSLQEACSELEGHAIICGFGRVGQVVARFLRQSHLPMVAVDIDPLRVREASAAGEPVFFGNTERTDVLKALGLSRARLLVLTYCDDKRSSHLIAQIRGAGHKVPILVRTSDDSQLSLLRAAGATEVVPETLEASLMLVSQVLSLMNVPEATIHSLIEKARRSRYRALHGYYAGEHSKIVSEAGKPLEKRHAVQLPPGAWACHRAISELKLDACSIDAIHRNNLSIEIPEAETRLHPGDTVILFGSAEQIERAESRMLGG